MRNREGELELSTGSVGAPPSALSEAALEEWNRLTTDPEYSAVLSPAFRGILIDYCALHGEMIADLNGIEMMPNTRRMMLHSLRMQLGITPASQAKVRMPKAEKPQSKWDDIGYGS